MTTKQTDMPDTTNNLSVQAAYELFVPFGIDPAEVLTGGEYMRIVERVLTDPCVVNPYAILRAIRSQAESLVAEQHSQQPTDPVLSDHFYLHCSGCGHWHALINLRRVKYVQEDAHNRAYGCPRTGIVVLSYKDTYD